MQIVHEALLRSPDMNVHRSCFYKIHNISYPNLNQCLNPLLAVFVYLFNFCASYCLWYLITHYSEMTFLLLLKILHSSLAAIN